MTPPPPVSVVHISRTWGVSSQSSPFSAHLFDVYFKPFVNICYILNLLNTYFVFTSLSLSLSLSCLCLFCLFCLSFPFFFFLSLPLSLWTTHSSCHYFEWLDNSCGNLVSLKISMDNLKSDQCLTGAPHCRHRRGTTSTNQNRPILIPPTNSFWNGLIFDGFCVSTQIASSFPSFR